MAIVASLPGKFGRFNSPSGVTAQGAFRWNVGFRRERLDTTTFDSDTDNTNVFSNGVTGVLDTTFQVEIYNNSSTPNLLFPGASVTCDLLFNRISTLGYKNIAADVLSFAPSSEVRGVSKGTAELQSNGLVASAV